MTKQNTTTRPETSIGSALWDSQHVAEYLGLNPFTVLRLCRERRIPHIRISARCYRFRPEDIRQWALSRTA